MELYFLHGLAESTRRTYGTAKRRYLEFCTARDLAPVPASEQQLCSFVAYLALDSLTHSTIKSYLSGVRHLHIEEGQGDPGICGMARLEQVLRGVKRVQAKVLGSPRLRLPISIELLQALQRVWERRATEDAVMLWAAAALCFFGFLRSGEITLPSEGSFDAGAHLCFDDIAVDSIQDPSLLTVRIKASKTDPFREGTDIYVGRVRNSKLCPVAALLRYMTCRGAAHGPLFRFGNGRPLTRARFVTEIKAALSEEGIDSSHYSGHSFRSGAATTAAEHGIGDATIQTLGRWKSNAYMRYVQTPRAKLAHISHVLAADSSP